MIRFAPWAALAAVPIVAACLPDSAPEPVYSTCRVLGSSDWQARVEILPGRSSPRRLVVTGQITTAGGIQVSLDEGPVSRLDNPVQQVMVRAEGSADGGAPVVHSVRGVFPALDRYGGVAIRCGDGLIAEIRDVEVPPLQKRKKRFGF